MQDEKDERILNLLRLKEELEKDLKKRGILRERRVEQRRPTSQPKIELEHDVDLPVENIWTVHDLNHYAYGISDEVIQRSLQRKLHSVKDEGHRYALLNLIKLLRGEKIEATRTDSVHVECLKILSDLYFLESDVVKDTIQLLKKYPGQSLVYLTAAEVFLAFGRFNEAFKLFQIYSEITKDPYASLVLEAYTEGQVNSSTFATCVSKDGYKSMLLIISALTEAEDKLMKVAPVLEKRDFACAQYISARSKGKTSKSFPHCTRLLIYNEALKFVQNQHANQTLLEQIAVKDPLARLLLVSVNLKDEPEKSFEHMKAFFNSVGEILYGEAEASDKPRLVRNLLEFQKLPKNFKRVSNETDLGQMFETLSSQDVWIFFRDPEYLRLYFGERHCKNTCFWEG
ncbi:hypothetical protein [Pseudothermotoga sp.]